LGVEYLAEDDFGAAESQFEQAVALSPNDAESWYALGFASNRAGDFSRSRQALAEALRLGHNELEARKELAWSLIQLQDFRCAVKEAERALQLAEDDELVASLHEMISFASAELNDPRPTR
jgi:Flp pilus assembly protein TadD